MAKKRVSISFLMRNRSCAKMSPFDNLSLILVPFLHYYILIARKMWEVKCFNKSFLESNSCMCCLICLITNCSIHFQYFRASHAIPMHAIFNYPYFQVFLALAISLMEVGYRQVAIWLTDFENHRLDVDYHTYLVGKFILVSSFVLTFAGFSNFGFISAIYSQV